MANKIYLSLDGRELALTDDSFKESFSAVDNLNTSEAGTTLRSVVRTGIPTLSITYKCDASEKKYLDAEVRKAVIVAKRWDETSATKKTWRCFMSNYSADLIMETPTTRFYKVSFKLNDLSTGDEES